MLTTIAWIVMAVTHGGYNVTPTPPAGENYMRLDNDRLLCSFNGKAEAPCTTEQMTKMLKYLLRSPRP